MLACVAWQAGAAPISRTQTGQYDLKSGEQKIYNVDFAATPTGATLALALASDEKQRFSAMIEVCTFAPRGTDSEGYFHLTQQQNPTKNVAIDNFVGYVNDNNLHIVVKNLDDDKKIVLEQDSLSLMMVDSAMMTLSRAGCRS